MYKISLAKPDITEKEQKAVLEVLKTSSLSLGKKYLEFEKIMAKFAGVKYTVAVNSGTSGLHLIIRALGIGKGEEVITTPFSFIASSNCILFEGARPVFADIDEKTLNIDVKKIEEKITNKTKAILAVDVFSHPADWDELKKIAKKHKLFLIEDSAEALGSEYKGKKCGSFGDAGVFAFYPNKQITTGEGGMILTNNKKIADFCKSSANQGRKVEDDKWLEHVQLGYNYRLDEMSCALGIAQMKRIKEILRKRDKVASLYSEKILGM
jgi:perosamine synthetase